MAEYCNDGRYKIRRTEWLSENQYRRTPPRSYYYGGTVDDKNGNTSIGARINSQYACGILRGYYNDYLNLGYQPENIIVGVAKNTDPYQMPSIVNDATSKGITKFYMDEPCHNTGDILCTWNNYFPNLERLINLAGERGATVLASESDGEEEWQACSNVQRLAEWVAQHGFPNLSVGCHTYFGQGNYLSADPRTQWTWLRNNLGARFSFAWIRLRQTINEVSLLFGHADNLGGFDPLIFGIWSNEAGANYQGTENAVQKGMQFTPGHGTQRLQKRYEFVHCCTTSFYDSDTCELESSSVTGEERWVP